MHRVERAKVREILHEYKRECFLFGHPSVEHHAERDLVERETRRAVEDILTQNFHYQFHKPVNPERAEVFGMIENYVREAVLPPVLQELVQRIVILEKRQAAAVRCMERLILLFDEQEARAAGSNER